MSAKIGIIGYYHVLMLCICGLAVMACYNAARITRNTGRIDTIEDLYHRSSDRWTGTDHREWANELRRRNASIDVPAVHQKRVEAGESK